MDEVHRTTPRSCCLQGFKGIGRVIRESCRKYLFLPHFVYELLICAAGGSHPPQDITKTGDDVQKLQAEFDRICELPEANCKLANPTADPLQALRNMVPGSEPNEMTNWKVDPTLNLRHTNPVRYDYFIEEGGVKRPEYNSTLSTAIGLDKKESNPDLCKSSSHALRNRTFLLYTVLLYHSR